MLHLNSIMILLIPVVVINSPSMPTTFKFHYDSINSSAMRDGKAVSVRFKFHYDSINSLFLILHVKIML